MTTFAAAQSQSGLSTGGSVPSCKASPMEQILPDFKEDNYTFGLLVAQA